jgi:diamine N-acetyltransferase
MASDTGSIEVVELTPDRRAACIALEVAPDQHRFVSPVSDYLASCETPGSPWRPFAVLRDGTVVGFVMCATDPADDSAWIGGLLIDLPYQRRGIGRAVVDLLVTRAAELGRSSALSYQPANEFAKALYSKAGFVETGETDDDEVVARRPL